MRTIFFFKVLLLIPFEGLFTSFFINKKSQRSNTTRGWWWKDLDPNVPSIWSGRPSKLRKLWYRSKTLPVTYIRIKRHRKARFLDSNAQAQPAKVSFFFPLVTCSVADPDPGSGTFLTPGSGIRNMFFPNPGSRIPNPYFWELSENFLGKKFYNSLKIGPNFILPHFTTKIICNFAKLVAT